MNTQQAVVIDVSLDTVVIDTRLTSPNQKTLERYRKRFLNGKTFNPLEITSSNVLVGGYAKLLVLREFNVNSFPAIINDTKVDNKIKKSKNKY